MGFKGMEKEVFLGCITLGIPYYIIKKYILRRKINMRSFSMGMKMINHGTKILMIQNT